MDEEKDEFYTQLQDTISGCKRHDMIVLMGDINAKIGSNKANREEIMEKLMLESYTTTGRGYVTFVVQTN